jgi:hypothetical protein
MTSPESARAAPARAGSDPRIEQLPGRLDHTSSGTVPTVQAAWIMRCFRLLPICAAIVAEIAFAAGVRA